MAVAALTAIPFLLYDGQVLGIERVAAVTALVAAVMTILMGLVANFPLALATELRDALTTGALFCVYQPKMDIGAE